MNETNLNDIRKREPTQIAAEPTAEPTASSEAARKLTRTAQPTSEKSDANKTDAPIATPAAKEESHDPSADSKSTANKALNTQEKGGIIPPQFLSPDEVKRLPFRTVKAGGELVSGRFDAESGIIYLENGQRARLSKPKQIVPPPSATVETPPPVTTTAVATAPTAPAPPPKKRHPIRSILAVFVLITVLYGAFHLGVFDSLTGKIEVVSVAYSLIPGDTITSDLLKIGKMSEEMYNTITIGGTMLYKWERREELIGMNVCEYVPAGQYLASGSVALSYTPPENPWHFNRNETELDLALAENLNPADIVPGAALRICVTRTVQENAAAPFTSATSLDGVTASQTTTQKQTFTLERTIISDVLTADGSSLYRWYSSVMSVPAGEFTYYIKQLMANSAQLTRLAPVTVRVLVTPEQAALFRTGQAEITMELIPQPDKSTDEKASRYNGSKAIADALYTTASPQDAVTAEAGGS